MNSLWPMTLENGPDPALRQHILAPLLAAMVQDGAGVVMGGLWEWNGNA